MDSSGNSNAEKLTAPEIIDRLEAQYQTFTLEAREYEQTKSGVSHLFEKWFRSASPGRVEPLYQNFADGVKSLTNALAGVLREMDDAGERDAYAFEAAQILLKPKSLNAMTTDEWYKVAAEYHCCVLVPFLKWDTLKRLRDEYVKNTPKRMMFPRQMELYKLMERQLASGEGR